MWASYIVHQVVDIWEVWETEQDTIEGQELLHAGGFLSSFPQ